MRSRKTGAANRARSVHQHISRGAARQALPVIHNVSTHIYMVGLICVNRDLIYKWESPHSKTEWKPPLIILTCN